MRKSPQKRVVKAGSYQFRKKITPWCILFFPMAFYSLAEILSDRQLHFYFTISI